MEIYIANEVNFKNRLDGHYYGMHYVPQNSYVEVLTPKMMVFEKRPWETTRFR